MSCDIFVIFYLHRYHIYLSSQQWTRCKVIRNITLTLWQSRAVTRVVVIKNSGIKTVCSDFYWQQLGCVPVMRSEEGWCKMRVMSLCPESHSLSLSRPIPAQARPELTPPETHSVRLWSSCPHQWPLCSWEILPALWDMRVDIVVSPNLFTMSNCCWPISPGDHGAVIAEVWAGKALQLSASLTPRLRMFTPTINVQNTWVRGAKNKTALVIGSWCPTN